MQVNNSKRLTQVVEADPVDSVGLAVWGQVPGQVVPGGQASVPDDAAPELRRQLAAPGRRRVDVHRRRRPPAARVPVVPRILAAGAGHLAAAAATPHTMPAPPCNTHHTRTVGNSQALLSRGGTLAAKK